MDNSSVGAKGILLTQIKQDFVTPANAIFDYLDIVEKAVSKLDLQSDDEFNQIKSSFALEKHLEDFIIKNWSIDT